MAQASKILKKVNTLKQIINSDRSTHIWQFSRVGGVNRVNLETGQDLVSLEYLDQKLWTALSCPVHGLEVDPKTLMLIDTDTDERIRVPEILEAVRWICSVLKNPNDLINNNGQLPLSAINDSTEEGKNLLASAKQILANLGKPDAQEITVEETSDTEHIFAGTKFNGDGIITEDSAEEASVKKIILDIISCVGSKTDRNGKEGINNEHVKAFFELCEQYATWYSLAEADLDKILPMGDKTADALASLQAIQSKMDDYFLRCRLAEFDANSQFILNSLDASYEEIRSKNLSTCIDEIANFPLTKIEARKALPLLKGINPAWEKALENFNQQVIIPKIGKKENLSETEWNEIKLLFEPYINWQAEKAAADVEKIGLATIRELLSNNTKESLIALIAKDNELESNTNNIILVDKLVRYHRDLYKLLKNYVTFYDFYSPHSEAIFQAGSLYIDQRCCDLCIKVSDMNKHNAIARSSGICLLYCKCFSKTKNEEMTIVAALTDGDIDNIEVGRNAIFYDRNGDDWDATIIKVIDNPISIRQAFWSPYRKVSKFISTQVEKVASEKEKAVENSATSKVESTSSKVDSGLKESVQTPTETAAASNNPTAAKQAFDIGKFVGIFAALSLALGAIGSVITSILTGFLSLAWWKMPLAVMGIILCISGPSMIIAWLKLRKRNLAPLLDANGWAINARATINIAFGNTLTHLATLPENAKLNLIDPFVKKKNPAIPIIIISVVIICATAFALWYFGFLGKWGIIGN